MKLLDILSFIPYPVTTGGMQAVFSMIDGLRKHVNLGLIVSLLPGQENNLDDLKRLWPEVTFYVFEQKRDFNYYLTRLCQRKAIDYVMRDKSLRGLCAPINHYTPDWIEFVFNTIKHFKPHIVQTEFYNGQDLVYAFPSDVKKVFVQHEIRYIVNQQWLETYPELWNSPTVKSTFNKLKADEITAMNNFDAVLTLNEADKEILKHEGVTSPIFSSPVCVTPATKRNACTFANKLIFVGAGGHPPNREGLLWFVREIWPSILAKYPQLQLHVIGKWSKQHKVAFEQTEQIYFDGFVESLQKALEGGISINPILKGSGIRMKILEAVNYGIPFISTTMGALGMGFEDGRDCFIADTSKEFIEKLTMLIENPNLREKFYKYSYEVYNNLYSKEAVINRRIQIYSAILSKDESIFSV